jgi:hypothetical protein
MWVCWDEYVIQSACWSASRDLPLQAVERRGIQEPPGCCNRKQKLYAWARTCKMEANGVVASLNALLLKESNSRR